ncbi:MAG: peptidase S8, partial [Bacteroidetes bacterium]
GRIMELQGLSPTGQPVYYETHNLDAAYSVGTEQLWSGGLLGLNLNGLGMKVGEWDGGAVRLSHQEFGGRVTQADNAGTISNHATHVAGTMIASGVQAQAHGMAPQALVDAYDWNSDDAEMAAAAANGLLISNHSYGTVTGWAWGDWAHPGTSEWHWFGEPSVSTTEDWGFGAYSYGPFWWDSIAVDAPYYLIVKSAGNDRNDSYSGTHQVWNNGWTSSTASRDPDGGADGYDCIGYNGNAKNILTVGAVNDVPGGYSAPGDVTMSSFSGWGPTDDGRIKPDLVANGVGLYSSLGGGDASYGSYSGTSMSSPSTSGSLLLLQEYHGALHGSYMRAATLKALVIHTADEAGANPGPDYAFGWGLLNTARAATHLANITGGDSLLEGSLNDGSTYTLPVYLDGQHPLRATLAWTDYTGTPYSNQLNPTSPRLVNDLDLRLMGNGGIFMPYVLDPANPAAAATTGDNVRDNVEQVYLAAPAAGWYTLQVSHKGNLAGGNQAFSLILSRGGDPGTTCLSGISSLPY